MKHRILFTLLMLFASVGWMSAAVKITIPAKGSDAAVTTQIAIGTIEGKVPTITMPDGSTPTFAGPISITQTDKEQNVSIGNEFKSLTVTGKATVVEVSNDKLETITLSNVGLTTLTLTSANGLKTLDVSGNEEYSFGLASNPTAYPNIEKLNLSGTKTISALGFGSYTKLTDLDVTDLELTTLSIPESVTTLKVGGNHLTSITNAPEGTVWGTQTITLSSSNYNAKDGVDVLGICVSNNILFNLADVNALKENKSKITYEWHKKVNGKYETSASNEVQNLYSDTNKELFIFGTVSGDKYVYINTESTYECIATYDGKIKMAIQEIKVTPAQLTLSLGDGLSAAVVGGSVLADQASVAQGTHILFTVAKEGYSLKTFKEVKGLTPVDDKQMTKNGGEFIVTGSVNKTSREITHPSIKADFEGEKCTVKVNQQVDGGIIKVESKYNNQTTQLTAEENSLYKGSELIITLTPDLGRTPQVLVNGTTYASNQMTPKDNDYILTIPATEVTKDLTILASFVENKMVSVELKIEGVSVVNAGHFVNGTVKIGNATYPTNGMNQNLVPGKTQLSFALTKQAVTGKTSSGNFGEGKCWIVSDIRLNTESKLASATVNEIKNPANDADAAIEYTVPLTIPTEQASITIVLKSLEAVTFVPEGDATKHEQTQVYDGNPKEFKFKTVPSDVVVEYKDANQANAEYSKEFKPTAVGPYNVKITRKAQGNFAALNNTEWKLVIAKATPAFETIPTVTIDATTGKYVIGKNGVVKFGNTPLTGKYSIVEGEIPSADNAKKSHMVTVQFVVNDGKSDNPNYNVAKAQAQVTIGDPLTSCTVDLQLSNGITGQLLNGDKVVTLKTNVPKTTKLTVKLTIPETVNGSTIKLYTAKNPATAIKSFDDGTYDREARTLTFADIEVTEPVTYVVKASAYDVKHEYKVTLTKQEVTYDGKIHLFDKANLQIEGAGTTTSFSEDDVKAKAVITYKDKAGNVVAEPENEGLYTVCVTIPYNGTNEAYATYKEYGGEFAGYLEIKKGKVTITSWPTKSSLIAKGQTLLFSELSGGNASVAGKFRWEKESEKPVNGQKYEIYFDPDNKNYDIVKGGTEKALVVNISSKNLVTFVPQNCIVTVVDAENATKSYKTGDVVAKGTKLKISVQANESFVMKTFTVNGKSFTSGSVYTVGDETVEIVAIAQLNDAIDPNTQYTVTLPSKNAVRGVVINKPGVNAVKKDQPFSFTLSSLAADADNIVVTVNGTALKPAKGVYTIAKVTANTDVKVSLAKPTALKVEIEKEVKNLKGYVIGTVQADLPSDGKFYYGDEITVVANPESGVKFAGWLDDVTVKDPFRTLIITKDVNIRAAFSGTPTDIESIETAKVYGSNGCIILRGIGEANVTIVSMDGRIQKQPVSGDTQIYMPAGIYGVVLEQGSEVKRLKVIVR